MPEESDKQSSPKPSPTARWLKLKLWLLDKIEINDLTVTLLWAGFIGIMGGCSSILFRQSISYLQALFLHSEGSFLQSLETLPVYWILLIPIIGAVIASFILSFGEKFLRDIPGGTDILEAIAIKEGVLRFRPSFIKALSSLFSIATGASLGREGSILQLSSMLASKAGQFLRVPKQRLSLLTACGAASGIAAAYNAPITGALFVMEIILGNFAIEIFGPLVFASVVATIVSHAYFGGEPIYQVPAFTMVNPVEIFFYLILGVLGGLVAPWFQKSLNGARWFFEKLQVRPLIKFIMGGLIMGLLGIRFPYLWGNGYETVSRILHGELLWQLVIALFFLKILTTSLCLGSGMVGGIFTPTLFLGAALGEVFGYGIHYLFPNVTGGAGGYALVGMGCLVAGTTHAPLTAIMILFEMSLNYSIILPLMLSCTLSTFIARQIVKESVYTEELDRKGAHITTNPEALIMTSMTVKDIFIPEVESVQPDAPFSDVVTRFFHTRRNYLYVTNGNGSFLGAISLNDLREIIQLEQDIKFILAYDIVNKNFLYTTPSERLASVMEKFWMQDSERLPVVSDQQDKKLIGTISKRDILGLYSQEVLGRNYLLTRFAHGPESDLQTAYVELGQDISVETLAVPTFFAGYTLADLNLPKRYNVQVILIRRKLETGQVQKIQSYPSLKLQKGDLWVVMGNRKDLNNLKDQRKRPLMTDTFFQDGEGI